MKDKNQQFIEYMKVKGLSDRTIQGYNYYYEKFESPLLDQKSVNKFIKKYNNNIAKAFIINYRDYLEDHYEELELDKKQRRRIRMIRIPKVTGRKKRAIPKTLKEEEIIITLRKNLYGVRNKLMLLITYYAGLRAGELLKIKPSDFNWNLWFKDEDEVGELLVYGKGNKEGIALIPPKLMDKIYNYIAKKELQGDEPMFKISLRRWQQILKEGAKRASITTNVYPHLLRHSRATELINKDDIDVLYVKDYLRHSNVSSTQIYAQVNMDTLKEKVKKYS